MYAHEGGQDTHKGRRYWLDCYSSIYYVDEVFQSRKKSRPLYFLLVMSNNGRCHKIPQAASKLSIRSISGWYPPSPVISPFIIVSKCRFVCLVSGELYAAHLFTQAGDHLRRSCHYWRKYSQCRIYRKGQTESALYSDEPIRSPG